MITPYKGPYPCPTCGQGEPEPLDEMQRLGQEFDDVMSGVFEVVAEQAAKEDRQDAEIARLKAELVAKDTLTRDLVVASCAIVDWYKSYQERYPSAYWFCVPYQLGEDLENILARAKEAGYA